MGLEDDVALFGTQSETYLAVADKSRSSRAANGVDDGDDGDDAAAGQTQMEPASKPWYAKLAAAGRPGLNKRHSSQGRAVAIPTVNVVGAETQ